MANKRNENVNPLLDDAAAGAVGAGLGAAAGIGANVAAFALGGLPAVGLAFTAAALPPVGLMLIGGAGAGVWLNRRSRNKNNNPSR